MFQYFGHGGGLGLLLGDNLHVHWFQNAGRLLNESGDDTKRQSDQVQDPEFGRFRIR